MKKFLITLGLVFVLLGGMVGFANAQENPAPDAATTPTDGEDVTKNPPTSDPGTSAVAQTDPASAKTVTPPSTKMEDGLNGVLVWIAGLFAWLFAIAVAVLDFSAYYSIFQMGKGIGGLQGIGLAWRVLRDVGNILFIFGFLVAGMITILRVEFYGFTKSMLPKLLIGAVFLNFSLFITEAIIDTGNLFASQFYTQINGGNVPTGQFPKELTTTDKGIAGKVMNQLGLQTIYGTVATNPKALVGDNIKTTAFMSIILFLIAAFVFFALAFILIVRYVVLVLLIILAPLGFAGLAIPKLDGIAKRWWNSLFKQAIIAPVLMLLLYIAMAVITDSTFMTAVCGTSCTSGQYSVEALDKTPALIQLLITFFIAMGLLLAVLVAAVEMGATGAKMSMSLAGAATFGATALALQGAGAATGRFLTSKTVQGRLSRIDGKSGKFAARLALRAGNAAQKSTFDVRNSKKLAAIAGATGLGSLGVTLGSGMKSSMDTKVVDRIKSFKEGDREAEKGRVKKSAQFEVAGAQQRMSDLERDLSRGWITDDEHKQGMQEASKKMKESLAKLSVKDLEELSGIKNGDKNIIKNLSSQQFDGLKNSDTLSEEQKKAIKQARFSAITESQEKIKKIEEAARAGTITEPERDAQIEAENKIIKENLGKMSTKELEELDGIKQGVEELVRNLSPQQFESLVKSETLTNDQKAAIKVTRFKNIADSAAKAANLEAKPTKTPDEQRELKDLRSNINSSVGALTKGELEALPSDMLTSAGIGDEVNRGLSEKQREIIADSSATQDVKKAVKAKSPVGKFESEFWASANKAVYAAAHFKGLTADQVVKLPPTVIVHSDVVKQFSTKTLKALQDANKLSDNATHMIANAIVASGSPALKAYITTGPGAAYWV